MCMPNVTTPCCFPSGYEVVLSIQHMHRQFFINHGPGWHVTGIVYRAIYVCQAPWLTYNVLFRAFLFGEHRIYVSAVVFDDLSLEVTFTHAVGEIKVLPVEPDPLTLLPWLFLTLGHWHVGPAWGGPHLSVTQSQATLSQRISFHSKRSCKWTD
jgi:hypothetical protein